MNSFREKKCGALLSEQPSYMLLSKRRHITV